MHIGVTGDIDATNRQALGRFVERHTRASQQIVLDLKQSRLFREPGFHPPVLRRVHCGRRDVDWMIVSNRAVDRTLRICDCDTELPVVNDLGAAVDRLDRCTKYHHTASRAGKCQCQRIDGGRASSGSLITESAAPGDCNPGSGDVAALVGGLEGHKPVRARRAGPPGPTECSRRTMRPFPAALTGSAVSRSGPAPRC